MSPLTTQQRELERESQPDERGRARLRLEDALRHRERSTERYESARRTRAELDAYVQLQESEEEVAARGRWLDWAEDEDEEIVPPWPDFLPLHRLLG
jgi:hypothetical protein